MWEGLVVSKNISSNKVNRSVLPMVGELKNLRLATEVHFLFKV